MSPTATEVEAWHWCRVAGTKVGGPGEIQLVHGHGAMEYVLREWWLQPIAIFFRDYGIML